jgi:hypothetical protein
VTLEGFDLGAASEVTPVPVKRMLQVSMDGPNVNWKMLSLLEAERDEVNFPKLLELGSCGLHVLHGAFLTGHASVQWKLDSVLSAAYYLFKDSPARRAEYTALTGSTIFPLKYCRTRWLDNGPAARRFIDIFKGLQKYLKEADCSRKTCLKSWKTLETAMSDRFLIAKVSFFITIAEDVEPFLRKFQTAKPMSPFLFDEMSQVLRTTLTRIVRSAKMGDSSTAMLNLNLDDTSNLKASKRIDIGFSAGRELIAIINQKKATELEVDTFRQDCREFLKNTAKKIIQRCPIRYPIVKAISCISPSLISCKTDIAKARMQKLLNILVDSRNLSSNQAESCHRQFNELCEKSTTDLSDCFKSWDFNTGRLDKFYETVLIPKHFPEGAKALHSLIKMVLILSHGNATVESGFSVNKQLLVENLEEQSLVNLR